MLRGRRGLLNEPSVEANSSTVDVINPRHLNDENNETFSLGEHNTNISYRDVEGYNPDFKPVDLKTQQGAEFLIARTDDNKTLQLRLDHIQSCKTIK